MSDETVRTNKERTKSKGKRNKKKRAHRWAFPIGLMLSVFAVIGLVTVVIAGINGVRYAVTKVKNIDEYTKMLIPVVMNDPDMFDDISQADMNQLLDISIWSILKSDLSPDTYEYSNGNMIIPEQDVADEYTKLFGSERAPVHSTVTGYGYDFEYNAAEKQYTIPLTGIEPTYTPKIVDVEKKSNTIVLTVAYLASDGWAQASDGSMVAPEPDKYVKVTLREKDSQHYISAMQMTSTPETAVTQIGEEVITEEPQTALADNFTQEQTSAEEASQEASEPESGSAEGESEATTKKEAEGESTTASQNESTTQGSTESSTAIAD